MKLKNTVSDKLQSDSYTENNYISVAAFNKFYGKRNIFL